MTDTNLQPILEKDISVLFGFGEMSDEEKAELLDDIGSVVLESAMLRFMTEGSEADAAAFSSFIESHEESENMLEAVIAAFPQFGAILEEEIVAFKREAADVLE
jgi:hypothetical protein